MQQIPEEQVLHIARLCKLQLPSSEIPLLASALSDTLQYVQVLESLDTAGVVETFQVTGLTNVFQSAEIDKTRLSSQEALDNAEHVRDDKFVAPAVFDRS